MRVQFLCETCTFFLTGLQAYVWLSEVFIWFSIFLAFFFGCTCFLLSGNRKLRPVLGGTLFQVCHMQKCFYKNPVHFILALVLPQLIQLFCDRYVTRKTSSCIDPAYKFSFTLNFVCLFKRLPPLQGGRYFSKSLLLLANQSLSSPGWWYFVESFFLSSSGESWQYIVLILLTPRKATWLWDVDCISPISLTLQYWHLIFLSRSRQLERLEIL